MTSVAAGRTVRPTGPVTISTGLLESVALTESRTVPATVGVPLTTQPVMDNPAGRVPERMVQLYGAVPPATPMVPLYGVPTVAFGRFDSVRVRAAGETASVTGPVMLFTGLLLSVAVTVNIAVPAVVGVPVITHPAPRVKPAGKVPAVRVQL
jgi:hypothetical protein